MVPGISERTSGATRFSHLDRLGTKTRATDASGNVAATRAYDAFGLCTGATDTGTSQAGFASAFGYQEDGESGLKLLGHRYYDPATGRFLTRDPAKDGRNWYAYCGNNPLSGVDPDGYKAGDKYKTQDEAATAALKDCLTQSDKEYQEYGGLIWQNADGTWSYSPPHTSGNGGYVITSREQDGKPVKVPDGATVKAHYHTHPYDPKPPHNDNPGVDFFSEADRSGSDRVHWDAYLGGGYSGIIWRYPYTKPDQQKPGHHNPSNRVPGNALDNKPSTYPNPIPQP